LRPILPGDLGHKVKYRSRLRCGQPVSGVLGLFCLFPRRVGRQGVGWTADAPASAVQHMGVNHRGLHVAVPQQFLHGPDVVAIRQEMRGERVAKSVAGDSLGQSRGMSGLRNGLLHQRFVNVVPPLFSAAVVDPAMSLGESKLPTPFQLGTGIRPREGIGQFRAAIAVSEVLPMHCRDVLQK